jgi:hypothetical protein
MSVASDGCVNLDRQIVGDLRTEVERQLEMPCNKARPRESDSRPWIRPRS